VKARSLVVPESDARASDALSACWTALRVAATVLHGVAQIVFLFPWLSRPQRDVRVQTWARTVLRHFAIELAIVGTPASQGPMLLVANHISWLDIVVLHAVCHCRFVAKADVKRWPFIGTLATGGGTMYMERGSRREAMRMVHRMAQALRDGDILAVFPEGTTTDGTAVLPFHSSLIQAAILADAPVQPVAIQFVHRGSGTRRPDVRYIGDESLVGSIWRTILAREVCAEVRFAGPQRSAGRDRRAWAQHLRGEIATMRQA